MKNLKITWKGTTPLIMHSCKCVNPLHPLTLKMKPYTDKKTKDRTEEDWAAIADIEWEQGAYWKDDLGLYIPAENVEATIINGGKHYRNGTDIQKYCSVTDLYIPFDYGENLTKEELIKNFEYRDTRIMTVQRAKIPRTRPRFDQWTITFNLCYEEKEIDLQTIIDAIEYAGQYGGLCDSRKQGYGRFVAIIEQIA